MLGGCKVPSYGKGIIYMDFFVCENYEFEENCLCKSKIISTTQLRVLQFLHRSTGDRNWSPTPPRAENGDLALYLEVTQQKESMRTAVHDGATKKIEKWRPFVKNCLNFAQRPWEWFIGQRAAILCLCCEVGVFFSTNGLLELKLVQWYDIYIYNILHCRCLNVHSNYNRWN